MQSNIIKEVNEMSLNNSNLNEKKTNVLAIYYNLDTCALVGVVELLKYIESKGYINFNHKRIQDVNMDDIKDIDVLVCVRGVEQIALNIINVCKKLKKYIIYYLDDDLLDLPVYSYSSYIFANRRIRESMSNIMKLSDCLWAVNKNIVSKYGSYFSKAVINDGPALSLDVNRDISFKKLNNIITIGFSGTIDHEHFIDSFLDKPIGIILDKYKNKIKFEFFGAKPKILGKYKMRHIPYKSEFEEYKYIMNLLNWDIGLAPLEKSSFTSCKYFNKFLEYGSEGMAGIYSNVEPYTFVVHHGENGILADNTIESWVRALSYLIENPDLRSNIQKNAFTKLKNEFNIEKISEKNFNNIPEILQYKA